jgi:DNA-binding SARP family transcriptional activator
LDKVWAMLGNRAEVRRVYERCRTLLREEVGLDPLPELEALYQTLQHQPASVNPEG